jgi:class 3 adenylate cyclase/sugar lactone lactonase YvrE
VLPLPSGTVTFLLTDIEGSTRQWQAHPQAMAEALNRHDQILGSGVADHAGTVLTERGEGDSVFAVFARASDAVAAACSIQRSLEAERWPGGCEIRVRMAVHTGEAGGDYRGSVVNRCARLRALARGGEILLSGSVMELALDHLPTGITLRSRGRHALRDLDRPERVFEVIDPERVRPAQAELRRYLPWAAVAVALVAGLVGGYLLGFRQAAVPKGPIITTFAGNGTEGYSADGSVASSASLIAPVGVAVDKGGNVYVVEGNRVRMVTPQGILQTVAGGGAYGFSGDGGSASLAALSLPGANVFGGTASQVAIDQSGVVYITDTLNQRIRKVSNGVITTFAGSGPLTGGFAGDGGLATSARLNSPRGVAVDARGNVYIADTENNRIRRVEASGVITTFAGTGDPGFLGDGGPAASAQLSAPQGLALDSDGDLFIADTTNNRIRKVDPGGRISTVAGSGEAGFSGDGGPATAAKLNLPVAVAVSSTAILYVVDTENNRVRKVDLGGTITTLAGQTVSGFSGDGAPASTARLAVPYGVAVDSSGAVYIADSLNNRVRRVD